MQQRTEIQTATRSVAFLFAGKKSVRCALCGALCEGSEGGGASAEYDALAEHLDTAHPEQHKEIISMARDGFDRR